MLVLMSLEREEDMLCAHDVSVNMSGIHNLEFIFLPHFCLPLDLDLTSLMGEILHQCKVDPK